jgi:hypothetical protein
MPALFTAGTGHDLVNPFVQVRELIQRDTCPVFPERVVLATTGSCP